MTALTPAAGQLLTDVENGLVHHAAGSRRSELRRPRGEPFAVTAAVERLARKGMVVPPLGSTPDSRRTGPWTLTAAGRAALAAARPSGTHHQGELTDDRHRS